jgi:hypothetical protein
VNVTRGHKTKTIGTIVASEDVNYLQINIQILGHCWKIYNLFLRVLETSKKANLWQAFLACFAAIANKITFISFFGHEICFFPH